MRMGNPMTVIVEDAVQPDVMPVDNDNKTFLVPLPQVPTEKKNDFKMRDTFWFILLRLQKRYSCSVSKSSYKRRICKSNEP